MFILVISEKMSEDMFVCFLFVELKLCNCGNALNMKPVRICTDFIFCVFLLL